MADRPRLRKNRQIAAPTDPVGCPCDRIHLGANRRSRDPLPRAALKFEADPAVNRAGSRAIVHFGHAKPSILFPGEHNYLSAVARTKDRKEDIMNLIRNYRNWRRYRETVNELSRLSNRELNDLGITRSDIATVAARGR
jgi:uncharacterized protein YjiS (DUF1127 family)